MKKLLILSSPENDLAGLLLRAIPEAACYLPTAANIPFDAYDALCVLGGDGAEPLILP